MQTVSPYFATVHKDVDAACHSIFINGINNTVDVALEITAPFSDFRHHIEHLVNPTSGFISDHFRILQGKNGYPSETTYELSKKLISLEGGSKKILLIGHSEGGVIIERALHHLQKSGFKKLLSRITVHTLGSSSFFKNSFGIKKLTHHVTLLDTLCFLQNPLILVISTIAFFKVLKCKIFEKKNSAHIFSLHTKFYWPGSWNFWKEHTVREGIYNEILRKKLRKENPSSS
jgi:hypothetical protein